MNIYVIIIAAFLVILMVMFGNNPVENARRKRAEEGSRDPLIHATEQYFSQKNRYNLNLPSSGNSEPAGNMPSGGYTYAPNVVHTMNNYPQYNYPQSYQQNPPPAQQDTGGYYPPAPPGVPPSPLQQQQIQQQP